MKLKIILKKLLKKFQIIVRGKIHFENYEDEMIKNGIKYKNNNISKNQLILLKNIKYKYPELELLNADKNRGNVVATNDKWNKMQNMYLEKN